MDTLNNQKKNAGHIEMRYLPIQKNIWLKGALLALCFGAIVFGIFSIKKVREQETRLFLSNALRDAHGEETVSIGGIQYNVSDGEVFQQQNAATDATVVLAVLQLAYEKRAARYAPLMALPGVDPKEVLAAVDDLRAAQKRLAAGQKNPESASLILRALYPTDFLDAIAHLEISRRTFLESGSADDAAVYEHDQRTAILTYHEDLSRFQNSFSKAIPASTTLQYATQKNTIGRDSILSALSQMDEGVSGIEKELQERRLCLRGKVEACDVRNLELPILPDSDDVATSRGLSLAKDITSLFVASGFPMETRGPLVLLPKSSCIAARDGTDMLFSFQNRKPDGSTNSYITPIFVGDIIFVQSMKYRQVPLFDFFAAKGTALVYQEILTFYTCSEIDREIGTIMSIYSVFSFAHTDHISQYATGAESKKLRDLERKMDASAYITQHMVSEYIRAAYSASLVSPTMPQATKNHIVNLWLEMTYLSNGTYLTMRNVGFFEKTPALVDTKGKKITLDEFNLFFARSAFAALFMESNPSVTGIHGSLFREVDPVEAARPYVFYSDMPQTIATQKEVVRDLSSYYTTEIKAR